MFHLFKILFILFIVITYCKYKINFTYSIIFDKWLTAPDSGAWDHAILQVALDNAC